MYPCNSEPSVEELLADPVARLLMARDGLRPEEVRSFVGIAKQKLAAASARQQEATHRQPRARSLAAAR